MIKHLVRKELDALIGPWAKRNGLDSMPSYALEEPPKNIGADLACNIAMQLAKTLKARPGKIAEEISAMVSSSLKNIISKIDIAGAGFINLTVSDRFLYDLLPGIITGDKTVCAAEDAGKDRILLEYVSANPTGPLHIGHGRGAAIGDCLARVFSFCGYNISREYYINDTGNQAEMLGKSLMARYIQVNGGKADLPENGYQGEYLTEIAKSLTPGMNAENMDFQAIGISEILKIIKRNLELFGITFDNWFYETTIAVEKDKGGKTFVENTVEELKEKGLAYENEEALWFASSKSGDDKDRVLRRSDGRYTYLASDVAYHKNKLSRGFTKLINLWGADHHGYVARMKAAIEAVGGSKDMLTVILYQLVSLVRGGNPVAMSTRTGDFVTLREVMDEVGKDACRFFMLLRAPDSHLDFDLELAKKQSSENPVFYVQYVHARCCSIFKEAALRNIEKGIKPPDLTLLKEPAERNLIKKIISLSDTLELCIKNLSPHHITTYLIETADLFHSFYETCRVLTDDVPLTFARLELIKAVKSTIKNGLGLLGVSAPEKM